MWVVFKIWTSEKERELRSLCATSMWHLMRTMELMSCILRLVPLKFIASSEKTDARRNAHIVSLLTFKAAKAFCLAVQIL